MESEASVASGRIQRTEPAQISPTCFLSMLTKLHSEALGRLIVSISMPLATEMGLRLSPHSRPIDWPRVFPRWMVFSNARNS